MILKKFGGLNTNDAPYLLPEGKAQDLYDVSSREGTLGKRAGSKRKFTTAGDTSPLAMYTHVSESGTPTRLILSNGNGRYTNAPTIDTLSFSFGTGPFKFATLRGLTVIAGTSKVCVFKDTSTFGELTEPQPAAGSASSGTGSLASGTYTYWFVLYSTALSQYGSPLGTSFQFVSSGTAPSISRGTVSTTGIWDKIAVFRSTVGGSTPLLVGLKANGDFPFNDTTADASLGSAFSPTDAIDLTSATDVVERDDRLFFLVENDRAVYYSESGKVSQISALGFLVALGGTDVPVALANAISNLFVLGRKRIFLIAGNTSTSYGIAPVTGEIDGCIDRRSVQTFGDKVYYRGKQGYYEFDGINTPVLISQDIDALARGFPASCLTAFNAQSGEYLIFVPGTYGHDDKVYRFDTVTREWWRDRYPARCGAMMRSVDSSTTDVFAFCDRFGYYSEYDEDVAYDGVSSGTTEGTATGGSATTLDMSSASFYTTGDKLKGMILEVTHGTTIERREVSTNTGTQITVTEAFSFTVTAGDTFTVAGIWSYWKSPRIGAGPMNWFQGWFADFEEQTGGSLEFTFYLDASATVGATETRSMGSTTTRAEGWVGRHGSRLATHVQCRGHNKPFALVSVEIDMTPEEG